MPKANLEFLCCVAMLITLGGCARPNSFGIDAESAPGLGRSDGPVPAGKPKHLPQDLTHDKPDRAERVQLVAQLWLTPLGKMFHHFLFENDPGHPPSMLSHQIIDRIHGDVRMTLTRSNALNLMIEDLYNTSELTPTAHDRIALLSMGLAIKRDVLQNTSSKEYLKFLPIFVATSLAAGSPLVRGKVAAIGSDLWALVKARFGRGLTMGAAREALRSHLGVGELFTREVFKNWSFKPAYVTFRDTFTYGSLIYYVARTGSAEGVPQQNKVWVYSVQRLVEFDEI